MSPFRNFLTIVFLLTIVHSTSVLRKSKIFTKTAGQCNNTRPNSIPDGHYLARCNGCGPGAYPDSAAVQPW